MKRALTTALQYKLSSDGVDLFEAIKGQMFDGEAPTGASLPFATYSVVSYTDISTFTEDLYQVVLQISLFSGARSSGEVKDLETMLSDSSLFRNQAFSFDGGRVITMNFQQSVGPRWNDADMETGDPGYWQTDLDYEMILQRG